MNHGEARFAVNLLRKSGHDALHSSEAATDFDPDGVVIFTCDVISTTEGKMWKLMEDITEKGKKLIVAGCLASVEGDKIRRRFPDALILDTMGISRLEDSIGKLLQGSEEGHIPEKKEIRTRLDHIVPISSGCLGSCTYCITREARGRLESNRPSTIADSLRDGLKSGYREILLASQDTGCWGTDLNTGWDLGYLLRFLTSSICEDMRIRIGMMRPDHLSSSMESILNGYSDDRIFRFFHLPVQSGSNEVLERMKREYDVKIVTDILQNIRKSYPHATISTDLITGFPGETREDHEKSLDILSVMDPDILNITRYSLREGTPAFSMEDRIPGWISKERSRELHRIHGEIVSEKLSGRLGYHENCLITEVGKPGTMMARDSNYTPIVIRGEPELLGKFADIDTDRIGPSYLLGRIVEIH
jgi:MiaB-like tRNA modifying enzyme